MDTPAKKDLIPQEFPPKLDWHTEKRSESLWRLYDFVNYECERAINWYYARKRYKSQLGYFLRVGSILAIGIAGVIPIIGEIFEQPDGAPWLSPAWATVALAIAALFVALDRFGGYTSGWVRYVRTAQKLCVLQANFRLQWENYRFHCPQFTDQEVKRGIEMCQEFLENVNLEVQNETNAWAQEFRQAIIEVDNLSKGKAT